VTQVALTLADSGPPVLAALSRQPAPRLLVAFPYWRDFADHRARLVYRDYILDSGAYSVRNSGRQITLDDYLAFALPLQDDPECGAVFALDVIGDWEATRRNYEATLRAGLRAIPTFHYGEPWEALDAMKDVPRIALGGLVAGANPRVQKRALSLKARREWIEHCFARVWPKWIHGFGVKHPSILRSVPFASVDTANWFVDPFSWGQWQAYPFNARGNLRAPRQKTVGGFTIGLRTEVEWYLKLERDLQRQWETALAPVTTPPAKPPRRKKALT
jgi:hypothetical protein